MKSYIYDPAAESMCIERIDDDNIADTIRADWEMFTPGDDDPGFCGNYSSLTRFVDGKFMRFTDAGFRKHVRKCRTSLADRFPPGVNDVMSSAMWLYRIVAVFDAPAVQLNGRDGYKCIWGVYLRHRKLDLQVTIYDYKGGTSLGARTSKCDTGERFTPAQNRAVMALLTGLASPELTHPYDGTVAGTVA